MVLAVMLHPESSRHVVALAPVIVAQVDRIALPEAAARLAAFGRQARLGWLLDSVAAAIEAEPLATESAERRQRRRTATAIDVFLRSGMLVPPAPDAPLDLFDPTSGAWPPLSAWLPTRRRRRDGGGSRHACPCRTSARH